MALPAHMEHVMASSRVDLTCGPIMATADRWALVISVLRIDVHFSFGTCCPRGCSWVAPWCQRYTTWRLMAATAHTLECPVVPWPIYLPLNPF